MFDVKGMLRAVGGLIVVVVIVGVAAGVAFGWFAK